MTLRACWPALALCAAASVTGATTGTGQNGQSAAVAESPHFYCDACVTTLEEFHWALQDGVVAATRRKIGASAGSSELRLDMVHVAEHICDRTAAPPASRMARYRADIVDGCEQIAASNLRPLILEFTGAVSAPEVLHARIQTFCADKLRVCPPSRPLVSANAESTRSSAGCGQCVLLVKDTWGVLNRLQPPPPATAAASGDRARHRAVRADIWDAVERACDGLAMRYSADGDRRQTGLLDACLDLVADYDSDIVDAIDAQRAGLSRLRVGDGDAASTHRATLMDPLSRLRAAPAASGLEDKHLRKAAYEVCVGASEACASPGVFDAVYAATPASPWLMAHARDGAVFLEGPSDSGGGGRLPGGGAEHEL